MGSEATGVDSTVETRANSSEPKLMHAIDDLLLFSYRPKKFENMFIIVETCCAAAVDPRMEKVVSSTYCNSAMSPGRLSVQGFSSACPPPRIKGVPNGRKSGSDRLVPA